MRYEEIEVVEHRVDNSRDIRKQVGLNLSYNELKKTIHYELGKEIRESVLKDEQIEKIILDILMYEDEIEDEYILDIEGLEVMKVGSSYIFALYYILEESDKGYIRIITTPEKEVERILKKK